MTKPTGGVDARRQAKGDLAGIDRRRIDAGAAHQCAQARPGRPTQPFQPGRDQPTILVGERHDVGDRSEADEIELIAQKLRVGAEQRLAQLVDDAGSAQPCEGIVAGTRRDDRTSWQPLPRPVMVGDDHIQPQLGGLGHFVDRRDAAVDRQHQRATVAGKPLEHPRSEPVAFVEAARQRPAHLGAELLEQDHSKRGRGNPVDVVVAVHADLLPGRHGGVNTLHSLGHVAKREGVVPGRLGGEKRTRQLGIGEASANEHRSGQLAQLELARQPAHFARINRLDRPTSLLHGERTLGPRPDVNIELGQCRRASIVQRLSRVNKQEKEKAGRSPPG